MAGNSQRRGAPRKAGTTSGLGVGSGGPRRAGLAGRGPTPPASARKGHPAARRAAVAAKNAARKPARARGESPELLVGRNPVVEALRAEIPCTALYVALGLDADERVSESVQRAAARGIAVLEVSRNEMDKMTGGILHQGIGLQVPPYQYADLDDVLGLATSGPDPALLVALDGVTDPRNLGAVVRSAAAFGAHGVIVPERRATPMTATAWRTSAGAAARLPIARVTNLVRSLKAAQQAGLFVVGLDADGDVDLDHLDAAIDPLLIVVGSEGRGLSRLVGETCDLRVSIPMTATTESLNAGIAAAVTLAEVARRRRTD